MPVESNATVWAAMSFGMDRPPTDAEMEALWAALPLAVEAVGRALAESCDTAPELKVFWQGTEKRLIEVVR